LTADVTGDVLEIYVDFELVVVEEVFLAEVAVWVEEDHVAELVDVASLQMFVELVESV
jgi:hypothetical protein